MDSITLIRHGQAGNRDDYDRLSELGRKQTLALREHFAREMAQYDLVLCGGLRRQRETATLLFDGFEVDERWNEFDLDRVYAEVAPQLAEHDAGFRADHEELQQATLDPEHPVHRQWRETDIQVVQAWMEGRFPTKMESWEEFVARIQAAARDLQRYAKARRVAIVTSATPIGIATGTQFHVPSPQMMQLAAALYNTSLTEFAVRDSVWMLRTFNNFAHLPERDMRTHR